MDWRKKHFLCGKTGRKQKYHQSKDASGKDPRIDIAVLLLEGDCNCK